MGKKVGGEKRERRERGRRRGVVDGVMGEVFKRVMKGEENGNATPRAVNAGRKRRVVMANA